MLHDEHYHLSMRKSEHYFISVIIPVFNAKGYLAECIDSVLAQTYRSIEIIVVDDGSTDGSAEILSGYGDRVTLVRQRNAGASTARNRGAAHAKGEFLAFLDSDDAWDATKLEKQVALLNMHTKAVATYCDHRTIDAQGAVIGSTEALECPRSSGRIAEDLIRGVRIKSPTLVMVRRSAFDELGGFDPTLRYAEDHDLFIRLAVMGPVLYQIETLASYRVHEASLSFAPGNELKAYEGILRVLEKLVFETPELPPRVRALARQEMYTTALGVGWARRRAGFGRESAQAYRQALHLKPMSLQAWGGYLRSLLAGAAGIRSE